MKYLLLPFVLIAIMALTGEPYAPPTLYPETTLHEALRILGAPERADVTPRPVDGASAELGAALVLEGKRIGGGRQSDHFKCTSCHNVVREDADIVNIDPEARLAFAEEYDLPFLPGTTLWGAVNRKSYYNGDYVKKYGDLVKNARRDLRGAIQLCATECAQGKPLDEVEMESVVAYLHTIGLRLADLSDRMPSLKRLNGALRERSDALPGLIKEVRGSFLDASPATFVEPPADRKAGYDVDKATLSRANGEILYRRACLHCHEKQRYSFFELDETTDSYNFMSKHFPKYTRYSTYQVSRYGTSPIPGKRAYMPHYTAERMSNTQVEELRLYLEEGTVR